MSSRFIYPDVIAEIRAVCLKHVGGLASADDMQRAVQRGEVAIVAIEEKDVRSFLSDVEGRLELIKFTIDDDKQLAESQKVATQVLSWLAERECGGSHDSPQPSSGG